MGKAASTDTRIAYGAMCMWWGPIQHVGSGFHGLPCCPTCKGMLMEVPNRDVWMAGAEKHESIGHPGYRAFIVWLEDRCFKTITAAKDAYETATGQTVFL